VYKAIKATVLSVVQAMVHQVRLINLHASLVTKRVDVQTAITFHSVQSAARRLRCPRTMGQEDAQHAPQIADLVLKTEMVNVIIVLVDII